MIKLIETEGDNFFQKNMPEYFPGKDVKCINFKDRYVRLKTFENVIFASLIMLFVFWKILLH